MITSVLKQIGELDRMDALRTAALDSYEKAVLSMAQYAVAVDAALVREHRRRLDGLRAKVAMSLDPAALQDLQSHVRAELRDYQNRSETALGKLRQECTDAVASVQGIMGTLALDGSDHLTSLNETLASLKDTALSADLPTLRRSVQVAAQSISEHVEAVLHENGLIIASVKDELRILQGRLDKLESETARDDQTGALNRSEFEKRIRKLTLRGDRVLFPMSKIQNYADVARTYSPQVIDELLRAVYRRYKGACTEKPEIGRWSEDTFVAIIPEGTQTAMNLSRDLASRLFPEYSVLDGDRLRRIRLRITTCVLSSSTTEDCDSVLIRIQKGIASLPQ